ncbi:MAG: hypothetical protein PHI85_09470 [Victivallaceae bacterium]|nr:hypothetical protein [Victivallaceae bacterium]
MLYYFTGGAENAFGGEGGIAALTIPGLTVRVLQNAAAPLRSDGVT